MNFTVACSWAISFGLFAIFRRTKQRYKTYRADHHHA